METCSPPFPRHEHANMHGLTHTPALAGLCILISNSGKCKNDPCDSEAAAVIKTLNERNGGNNVCAHPHAHTHTHTRHDSVVKLFLCLILGNDL